MRANQDRAVFFVDGSNWYHACTDIGLSDLMRLNYVRVCSKLAGSRRWIATRYYVGQVPQTGNTALYANQRRFLARLGAQDSRITIHLGRIERRTVESQAARALLNYLAGPGLRLERRVRADLESIARVNWRSTVLVEKAVDVQIAVDMVAMSERHEYDTAYLLSADGDLTPAVEFVRSVGRRAFVASPAYGARLARAADSYIRLPRAWFDDCY